MTSGFERLRFAGLRRELDQAARAAVDLHRYRERLYLEHRGGGNRKLLLVDRVRLTQPRPQLFRQVRCERRQQEQHAGDLFAMHRVTFLQRIQVRHERCDGGVVAQLLQVLRHRLDRAVQRPPRIERGRPVDQSIRVTQHQVPHAAKKTAHAADARIAELTAAVIGSQEHEVHPQRVSPKSIEVRVGIDHVTVAFAHLAAMFGEQTVRSEAAERLLERQVAQVVQRHGDEAAVQQVQNGVLRTADIHVDGQPLRCQLGIERPIVEGARWITQEVPGGVEKVVGDVRLEPRRAAARWAPCLDERGNFGQRRRAGAAWHPVRDVGQKHGQLVLRHRHDAAPLAVNDGNRWTPVALARNEPISKPILNGGAADLAIIEPLADPLRRDG